MRRLGLALLLELVLLAAPAWAAPSCALLTNSNGKSTDDATSRVTGSVTITANRLVLFGIATRVSSGTPDTPTVTSTGATWVLVNSQVYGSTHTTFVFRTMVSSNQTGAITADFGSETQITGSWGAVECSSVDTSGTNGSGAIVASSLDSHTGTTSYVHDSWAAYSSTDNRPVIFIGNQNGPTTLGTFEAGWDTLDRQGNSGEGVGLATAWQDGTSDTTTGFTTGSNNAFGSVGVEVKNATAAGGGGVIGRGLGPGVIQ